VEATTAPTTHLDGDLDVFDTAAGDLGYPVAVAKGGAPYDSCTTAYCHSNGMSGTALNAYKSATWGGVSTGCSFCHNALPTTGAHGKHVKTAATAYGSTSASTTGGNNDFGCGNCHPVNTTNHMNGTLDITLNNTHGGTLKAMNNIANDTGGYARTLGVTATCSAAYCHSKGNGTFIASPDWYGTFSGDSCGSCHGNTPDTGSHPTHVMAGIHYNTIYTGTTGLKPAATRANITGQSTALRPHGNSATATTINCNICHNGTVTAAYNRRNSQCVTCHDLAQPINAPIGDADMIIAAASTLHLNGAINVQLPNATTVRSKAQIRGTTAPAGWTRNNNYKDAALASNDSATMNSADWAAAPKTCTTACHLNEASPAWGTPTTCSSCHTTLP
jgi:predicted CxxxxCH...CXXCH cytochrome family protein